MPTTPVRILGFALDLPQPYSAGHCCSAAEAAALNRILVKGLSKGLHKVLSAGLRPTGYENARGLSEDQKSDIVARGEEYVADYCLGFAQGHETQRAIRVECERIARQMLETTLYRQGKKLGDLPDGERDEEIARLAASEKVREEAERRIRVTQEIANRAHDDLLEVLGNGGIGSGDSGC